MNVGDRIISIGLSYVVYVKARIRENKQECSFNTVKRGLKVIDRKHNQNAHFIYLHVSKC